MQRRGLLVQSNNGNGLGDKASLDAIINEFDPDYRQPRGRGEQDSLSYYMRAMSNIPRLKENGIEELLIKRDQASSKEERKEVCHEIFEGHVRFVVALARKKFPDTCVPRIDLIHEGNHALLRAANKFPFEKMTSSRAFMAYAGKSILKAMRDKIALAENPGFPNINLLQRHWRLEKCEKKFLEEQGRLPTLEEIQEETGIGEFGVQYIKNARLLNKQQSLHAPIEAGGETQFKEIFADAHAPRPDAKVSRDLLREILSDCLDRLPEKERETFKMLYGIEREKSLTQAEAGKALGVSHTRIQQWRDRGFEMLKRMMGDYPVDETIAGENAWNGLSRKRIDVISELKGIPRPVVL